jgi:hypothetical protein
MDGHYLEVSVIQDGMHYPLHPIRFVFICLHCICLDFICLDFICLADDGSDKKIINLALLASCPASFLVFLKTDNRK